MTQTKMAEAELIAFVDTLDVEHSAGDALALTPSRERAFIDLGSVVCFTSKVTSQHKRDVLDSMLLAQAAANKKHNREVETEAWHAVYRDVLEKVGWTINNFSFSKYHSHSESFTMDEVVLELIVAIASQDEQAILDETINALRALKGSDGRIVLFDQSSHSESKGSFQVTPASEDGSGNVTMCLSCFYFSTQARVTNLLWFRTSESETDMYYSNQRITLNDQTYKVVRAAVRTKVQDLARKTVKEIET